MRRVVSELGRAKDPNAPKRPKSAYMCWRVMRVRQVKSENPDMNHKDAVKRASEVGRDDCGPEGSWGSMRCRFKKEYEEKMKGKS